MTPELALEMRAYRNARYHEDREGHFQALARWANFAVVVFGSSAFGGGWAEQHGLAAISGGLAAVIGAAQLAFDFSGKASFHHDLRRQYLDILTDCKAPDAQVELLSRKLMSIYAGEPEVYHAVNALAYNATQEAYERDPGSGLVVGRWYSLMRHWLRFKPTDFPDQRTPENHISHGPAHASGT